MTKINIKTKGMHCGSCEMLVTDELKDHDGIIEAEADHKSGVISVEFDENKVDIARIKEIIKQEGYETE